MALIFWSKNYESLYNCSFYDYQSKPLEERSWPFYGALLIITFVVIWKLYIPCIIVMCTKELLKHSCYKLMVFLGFCDLHTGIYIGIYAGYTSITGNVFCHWPTTAFWVGCFNGFAWKMQSTTVILLAFNRCVEAMNSQWGSVLFENRRVFLWMILPVLWGCTDLLWNSPGFYSPIMSLIVYHPHIGYFQVNSNDYLDFSLFPSNVFVSTSIFIIYGTFGIFIYLKSKDFQGVGKYTKVFGQILFIALFLFMISVGFVINQFVQLPIGMLPWLQYTFLVFDGQPAIIYLTLNSNLRRKVMALVGIKWNPGKRLFKTSVVKTNSIVDN